MANMPSGSYEYGSLLRPGFPGDNINNASIYFPRHGYDSSDQRMQYLNAQKQAEGHSRANAFYSHQGMFPFIASSGPAIIQEITLDPRTNLNHTRKISPNDDAFLTMQRASESLHPEQMARVFAASYGENIELGQVAAQNIKGSGVYIVRPDMGEEFIRGLKSSHSAMAGTVYEDAIFEQAYWHDFVVFDQSFYVYGGPHAWSYNAPLEKTVQAGLHYAMSPALDTRDDRNSDSFDVYGNAVSQNDIFLETARGWLDVVTTGALYNGSDIRFRFDSAAAELVTRAMYDHMHRNNIGDRHGSVHSSVKEHYTNQAAMDEMAEMQSLILPYIAEHCQTKTFEAIVQEDPMMEQFWNEVVIPSRKDLKSEAEIVSSILGKLPRGGHAHPDIPAKLQKYADPQTLKHYLSDVGKKLPKVSKPLGAQVSSTKGQKENVFSEEFAPMRFDPNLFKQLGHNPYKDIDRDEYLSAAQEAAKHTMSTIRPKGTPSPDYPYNVLWLDIPEITPDMQEYRKKYAAKGDVRAQKAAINPLSDSKTAFKDKKKEVKQGFDDEFADFSSRHKAWLEENGVGRVLRFSTIEENSTFTGKNAKTGWNYRDAISAGGDIGNIEDISVAVAARYVESEGNGVILPVDNILALEDINEKTAQILSANLLAVTGLSVRVNKANENVAGFYTKSPEDNNFEKLGLNDLMIGFGVMVKPMLEKPNPTIRRHLFKFVAQLIDVYNAAYDPATMNSYQSRKTFTGQDDTSSLYDLGRIDTDFLEGIYSLKSLTHHFSANDNKLSGAPNHAFQSFMDTPDMEALADGSLDINAWMNDPIKKPELARMMMFYIRDLLLKRGMGAFEFDDVREMHTEFPEALDRWGKLSAAAKNKHLQQTNPSRHGHIETPAVAR